MTVSVESYTILCQSISLAYGVVIVWMKWRILFQASDNDSFLILGYFFLETTTSWSHWSSHFLKRLKLNLYSAVANDKTHIRYQSELLPFMHVGMRSRFIPSISFY